MKNVLLAGVVVCGSVLAVVAAETHIRGGRLELLERGTVVLFTDGVTLDRGGDRLTAQRMRTTQKRDKVTATGNVALSRIISSTESLQGFGQTGFYDTEVGRGHLLAGARQARMIYTEVLSSTLTRTVDVFADRFDFDETRSVVSATGRVSGNSVDPVTGDQFAFWSERAVYTVGDQHVVLSGRAPSRIQRTTADGVETVTGDVITYHLEEERIVAEGGARAVFEDRKGQGESS